MFDIIQILRDALPEAIGGLTVAVVIAIIGTRSYFRRARLQIYFDPSQTYLKRREVNARAMIFFCHVMVKNTGRATARNCLARLVSVKRSDASGKFMPHNRFQTPVGLKWAYKDDYDSIEIERDLPMRLDLCYSSESIPKVLSFATKKFPTGNATDFPTGLYLIKIRITAENSYPTDKEFLIYFPGIWDQIQILYVPGDRSSAISQSKYAFPKSNTNDSIKYGDTYKDEEDFYDDATEIADFGYIESRFSPAKLILESDSTALPKEASLSGEIIRIGRGVHCDIILKDSRISRIQATIMKKDGLYYIRDEGGASNTYISKPTSDSDSHVKLRLEPTQEVLLKNGDVIYFGTLAYRFEHS